MSQALLFPSGEQQFFLCLASSAMSEIQCVEYKEWDGKEEKISLIRKKHMAMHMHADLHQKHMWLDDRMAML